MSWIEAIILGVIQGLTEFLPVSSSGHLAIVGNLFGMNGGENLAFAVLVHVATVLSTVTVLWKEISGLFRGLFAFRMNDETRLVFKILISMIPIGIVGLFFKDYVESLFGSGLFVIGCMLLVSCAFIMFASLAGTSRKTEISYLDAFIIGIAQAVAAAPGISRSGATISTGVMLGNKKEDIAKFSFLMVIIPVLGEALLDVVDAVKDNGASMFSTIPAGSLICGFIAAYVSGAVACKWMINIVRSRKMIYFAYYLLIASVLILIFTGFK